MSKPKILCIIGTRPEAIKMAPVVLELRRFADVVDTVLVSTGQHKEILYKSLETFGLVPDIDLAIMQHGQTLAQVTSRALEGIDRVIAEQAPNLVLAQGDTTTVMAAGMAAFYRDIAYGHIEAGLRTDSVRSPFPEEYNRRVSGLTADLHFAPTTWSRDNLLKEGKDPSTVYVTGNTGIDAVLQTAANGDQTWYPDFAGRVILLTTHRRENWGEPQKNIAEAARALVDEFPDTMLVAALHPNPTVRDVLVPILGGHPRIELIEPPEYALFVKLIQRSHLILSDSGGVQEEAPAFGIPVLVLRLTTERPEGVAVGTAKLVGSERDAVYAAGHELLASKLAYDAMANAASPYGDGKASERTRLVCLRHLGIESPEVPMWA